MSNSNHKILNPPTIQLILNRILEQSHRGDRHLKISICKFSSKKKVFFLFLIRYIVVNIFLNHTIDSKYFLPWPRLHAQNHEAFWETTKRCIGLRCALTFIWTSDHKKPNHCFWGYIIIIQKYIYLHARVFFDVFPVVERARAIRWVRLCIEMYNVGIPVYVLPTCPQQCVHMYCGTHTGSPT